MGDAAHLAKRDGGDGRDARERAARKACLSGNSEKGSEILSDLYLDYKDPTYIYNLGRCYEQNHRYEDAISRFREYLLKDPKLTDVDRADAEKHIARCLSYLGKSEPARIAPHEPPSDVQTRVAEAPKPVTAFGVPSPVAEVSPPGSNVVSSTAVEQARSTSSMHARQPGLFFQFERVLVPGLSYGIVAGLEIQAGALIGYYKGTWLGLRYLLLDGAIKPGIGLAMPLFFVESKAVAGIEGNAIVQWDFSRNVGLYGSVGLSYFPRPASDLGSLWFLPGVGAQVRL